ncbi:MAG: VWA domain-containing protein, partial [Bryobacterales bacterium]|nr:VWA domain-containing protein [Bryobacterales bacterium]
MLLLLSLSLLAQAQTFRTTTQLVVETVTVKDKDGRPLTGLKAEDFAITEDGVAQQIRYFEFQKLDTAAPVSPITDTRPVPPFARLPRTQILPPTNGDTRYRDRRLLALYFDFTAMPATDQMRAFQAAKQFVKMQMTSADLLAIMAFTSGSVQVFQDFTGDRERLLRVLETLLVGEDENASTDGTDSSKADTGAAFGQNDSEFNIF